jgi:hypothetical protein
VKVRGQTLEGGAAAIEAPRFEFAGGQVHPVPGDLLEGTVGVVGAGEALHLLPDVGKPSFSEFAIGGLERAAKLLAAAFDQRIVTACRFEAIQTLADLMEDNLRSVSHILSGMIGSHAEQFRVTKSGDKSEFDGVLADI